LSLNLTQRLRYESTSEEKENAIKERYLKAPLFLVSGYLLSQGKTQKGIPWHLPRTHEDKTYRNEKLKLAENIKAKRMMELANEAHGFPTKEKLNQNFIAYFEKQMNKRGGNSKTAWLNTFKHLNDFCGGTALFTEIDREWLEEFIEYVHTKVSPSSVSTYFAKVKCPYIHRFEYNKQLIYIYTSNPT